MTNDFNKQVGYVLDKSEVQNPANSAVVAKAMELTTAYRSGHSAYQILMFILGDTDNPTPDSKYQQALREIDARVEALKSNYYSMRKAENEIEQYEVGAQHTEKYRTDLSKSIVDRTRARLTQEASENEICRLNMQLDTLRKDTRKLIRELDIFVAFCNSYKDKLSFPPLEYMNNLQAEHERFSKKLGLPELANHALSMNNTEPEKVKDVVAAKLEDATKVLAEFKEAALIEAKAPVAAKVLEFKAAEKPLMRGE